MKIKNHISRFLFALLVAGAGTAMLFTSCREYDESLRENSVPLTFYLQAHQTRVYEGDLEAEENSNESTIYNAKVWLFEHEGGFLDYQEGAGSSITMKVPQRIVSQNKTVDVYIIANYTSAGITANGSTTDRETIEALTIIGNDYFTPAAKTDVVPNTETAKGLPMSHIEKNLTIVDSQTGKVKEHLDEILLTRAVSKIRFAFAKTPDHTGEIMGIMLDGNQIAANQHIFPVDPETNTADYQDGYWGDMKANMAEGYISDAMTINFTQTTTESTDADPLVASADIEEVEDPSSLIWPTWSNASAQATLSPQQKATNYDALMDTYVTNKVYLRESNKPITGYIYYRLSPTSPVKRQEIYMLASDVKDFTRNHVWIVYCYFLGDKFDFKVQTIPWEDSYITVDYSETIHWKDGGEPKWLPTLDATNSTTETIAGTQFTVIRANGGDEPSCAFQFDAPVGWQWVAVLEPLTEGASNYISFLDGSESVTGNVGQQAVINLKISTTYTTVNHRSRLRLFVRTPSGDQSREVPNFNYIISRNI